MKKLSLFVVIALIFVVGTRITRAQNPTLDTREVLPIQTLQNNTEAEKEAIQKEMNAEREKTKQDITAKRGELKTKMEVLRESIKKEKNIAKAKTKTDIITGRENALNRFDQVVGNLTDLKDKINNQIAHLKTNNVDTTGAEAFIATSETRLNDLRARIVDAHTLFSASLNELTTADKTSLLNITNDIQSITNDIRDTLNNAIQSLKDSIINKK